MKDSVLDTSFTIHNSEESLWKAVILQAFIDLQSNSKKKSAHSNRIKALLWFNIKNDDFVDVCNNANLDPDYVWAKANVIKESINFSKRIS